MYRWKQWINWSLSNRNEPLRLYTHAGGLLDRIVALTARQQILHDENLLIFNQLKSSVSTLWSSIHIPGSTYHDWLEFYYNMAVILAI